MKLLDKAIFEKTESAKIKDERNGLLWVLILTVYNNAKRSRHRLRDLAG